MLGLRFRIGKAVRYIICTGAALQNVPPTGRCAWWLSGVVHDSFRPDSELANGSPSAEFEQEYELIGAYEIPDAARERSAGMTIVYYTFGKGSGHPYEGGWVKVAGEGGRACDQTFRALYPDKTPGLLNCAGRYTEWEFLQTKMPEEGNYGAFCQAEHIQPGAVEHRMEAAVNALYEGTDANGGG